MSESAALGATLGRERGTVAAPVGSTSVLRVWWPLIAITLLAAVVRLATLDAQSLWYDEAFTPVHVLRASLFTTLHNVVHTENTPPLWYVLEWGVVRVLGNGAFALRLLSALAGIATVPVAWAIGRELQGPPTRRAAIVTATLVAVNPLLVWYSQEARAYGLFVLTASLAMLCFLRAARAPTARRMGAFGLSASLVLCTHYFAVFLLIPMVAWLVWVTVLDRSRRSRAQSGGGARLLLGIGPPLLVGFALVPLIVAQGGHGTQWIGRWALTSRLEAIPQYYLTGYTGAALGHGIELLVGLVALAGVGYGLWSTLTPREERGALIALVVSASGVLIPVLLAGLGADYLAPRNLVAAMIPLSALLAVVIVARRAGRVGMGLAGLLALGFLVLTIDVSSSPRLQRGDWSAVAGLLRSAQSRHAIVTVELGAAPFEYYLPPLRNLARGSRVKLTEIDETGYAPLRSTADRPPAPGFHLSERRDIHGLIVYRFTSRAPVTLSELALRRAAITEAHPEVLVPIQSTGKQL